MTTAVMSLPATQAARTVSAAAAANKAGFAARLTSQAASYGRTALGWLKGLPGASKVLGFVGKASGLARRLGGFSLRIVKSPAFLWNLAGLAFTDRGRETLHSVIVKPIRWALGLVGKVLRAVIRTPLSWVGAQKVYDTPATWLVLQTRSLVDQVRPHVAKVFDTQTIQMHLGRVVTSVGFAYAMRSVHVLGPVSPVLRWIGYLGAVSTVIGFLARLARKVPAVQNVMLRAEAALEAKAFLEDRIHTPGDLAFAENEVVVAEMALAENPTNEKLRKDLIKAQKIEEQLRKKAADQTRIDEQMALLDSVGLVEYAIMIRQNDPRVGAPIPSVMSYKQAVAILKENGLPHTYQQAVAS